MAHNQTRELRAIEVAIGFAEIMPGNEAWTLATDVAPRAKAPPLRESLSHPAVVLHLCEQIQLPPVCAKLPIQLPDGFLYALSDDIVEPRTQSHVVFRVAVRGRRHVDSIENDQALANRRGKSFHRLR